MPAWNQQITSLDDHSQFNEFLTRASSVDSIDRAIVFALRRWLMINDTRPNRYPQRATYQSTEPAAKVAEIIFGCFKGRYPIEPVPALCQEYLDEAKNGSSVEQRGVAEFLAVAQHIETTDISIPAILDELHKYKNKELWAKIQEGWDAYKEEEQREVILANDPAAKKERRDLRNWERKKLDKWTHSNGNFYLMRSRNVVDRKSFLLISKKIATEINQNYIDITKRHARRGCEEKCTYGVYIKKRTVGSSGVQSCIIFAVSSGGDQDLSEAELATAIRDTGTNFNEVRLLKGFDKVQTIQRGQIPPLT